MYANTMRALLIFSLLAGCNKNREAVKEEKSTLQLLTQQSWTLAGAGFDDNKNGVLDAAEDSLQDCQKDNTYQFRINGTGSAKDNAITCGNPVNTEFTWTLVSNETKIEIESEPMHITRLTENEMILVPIIPWLNTDFIVRYRH